MASSERPGSRKQRMAAPKLSECQPAVGHCCGSLTEINSVFITTLEASTITVPGLQGRKQCHREAEQLAEDHTAGKW